MTTNKIIPCLWFHTDNGDIAKVIEYYKNIFGEHFQAKSSVPLGNTPSGNTEICDVYIFGQKYTLMSTAMEHHIFNDAVAFTITCVDQKEIDTYWDYFTQEGGEVQCGWCIDRYGLRWQILPENMGELMRKQNSFEIMMKQKKIIIEEYLK